MNGRICSECICSTNVLQLKEGRNEGRKARTGRRERKTEGRRTREKAREKEQLTREREKALDSICPETNNSVLSWINTRISFLLPFTPALDNILKSQNPPLTLPVRTSFTSPWLHFLSGIFILTSLNDTSSPRRWLDQGTIPSTFHRQFVYICCRKDHRMGHLWYS